MPAAFTVDPRSGVPLYLQLIEQVKRAVALGALSPGEQLPTVKALALVLTINPNTVARVYRELERDGVIETSPGRGSFVRHNGRAGAQRTADDVAERTLTEALREARSLGLERSDIEALVARLIDRWFPSSDTQEPAKS
jgi:GntR family transcriptional regulator